MTASSSGVSTASRSRARPKGSTCSELLALKGDIPVNLRKLMDVYENGLAVYFERDWKFALQHFNTVLEYRPGDGPSQVLAARCRRFMVQSPPETWNPDMGMPRQMKTIGIVGGVETLRGA